MRIKTTTTLAAGLLLALTACGTADNPPAVPSDKQGADATTATPAATAKTYTFQDCVDLLDYDFTDGKPKDASKDPECAHLTPDEYVKAVGEVLTKHKDEILNSAVPTP
ncbi:hypothetical protein [Streptomyces filamentosus]|uniref:hypothetical protein n=1 Tax=Streptomyces filamentosus TaxID=67294 RepID=UPI0037D01B99